MKQDVVFTKQHSFSFLSVFGRGVNISLRAFKKTFYPCIIYVPFSMVNVDESGWNSVAISRFSFVYKSAHSLKSIDSYRLGYKFITKFTTFGESFAMNFNILHLLSMYRKVCRLLGIQNLKCFLKLLWKLISSLNFEVNIVLIFCLIFDSLRFIW